MRHVIYFSVFLCFSLVSPSFLLADEAPPDSTANTITAESPQNKAVLPEVVVTANRLDTPVSQVANSMTVITKRDLDQKQITTVLDALRGVPGLDLIKSGGSGQLSSVFIRGGNGEHTLVLFDGIPLNDPISTTRQYADMDQLSVDNVKQIEVVRGPESPVFGSNAMGGVVNIITQEGVGTPSGSLLFEGGAYNTIREVVSARGGDAGGNFSLSASRYDTDGFPSADKSMGNIINNPDGNTTASLRLNASPTNNFEGHIIGRFVQSRTGLDDGSGPGMDNPNFFVDGRQFLWGGQAKLKLLNGDWEQTLGLSFTDHQRVFNNKLDPTYPSSFDQKATYDGQLIQAAWQNNLRPFAGETLVAGVQLHGESAEVNDVSDYGWGPTTTLLKQTSSTASCFVENQTSINDRLFLTLGGRLDSYNSFGSQYSFRGAAAFFIPGLDTKLKATYGTGFKAPSLYQLYSPYGNTALAPESSLGFDAGFEQPIAGKILLAGATYFHNDYDHLIDYDFATDKYININQAQTEGWETFVTAHPVKDLECRANYTYTFARNTLTGEQLLRRPQSKAGFDAFYKWDAADFGLSLIYLGDRQDVSFPPPLYSKVPVTLPSYFLVNVMASYTVSEHLKLFARANNLLNQAYEEVYGYGTAGLSVYAGTKVSF